MSSVFTRAFFVSALAATIRLAAPILLASLGAIYTQRAGILNLGLEGAMTVGAAGAFITAYFTGNLYAGLAAAMLFCVLFSLIMAWMSITVGANQVIAGTAMSILGVGFSAFIYRTVFGIRSMPPQVTPFGALRIPVLADLPFLGPVFFEHNLMVYLSFALVFVTWVVLEKTVFGLNVKMVGEHPRAADAKGINVRRIRYLAMMIEALYAGAAGAFMSTAYMNIFLDNIVTGRGFIAIAVVIFARWQPARAMAGALLFGFASALQMRFQAMGVNIPNQFLLMSPYVLTILVLISVSKKAEFPSAYTQPYSRMDR